MAADSLSDICAPTPSAPGFVVSYYGCRFRLVLTAIAELVAGVVLTVAAGLLVERLVYYVYEGGVREVYRPKGLLAYATASREYVRPL